MRRARLFGKSLASNRSLVSLLILLKKPSKLPRVHLSPFYIFPLPPSHSKRSFFLGFADRNHPPTRRKFKIENLLERSSYALAACRRRKSDERLSDPNELVDKQDGNNFVPQDSWIEGGDSLMVV